MSSTTAVVTDALSASALTAKIAATAAASTAISFPPGRLGKLHIANAGPNLAYVQVGNASGVLAALPGATFGAGGIPCPVGNTTIDTARLARDAGGLMWVSTICDAAGTAALVAAAY